MSALLFPDVSEYNADIPAGVPLVIARASIGDVRDAKFDQWRQLLAGRGVPLHAYHFLNSGKLGVSAQAQADFAFSVIGPNRPTMIDLEPNRGYCATLDEGAVFADRFRSNGGTVHLCYLPRWSWSGWMGSPSLLPLADRAIGLVSSNYTTYSDTGPGWAAYGGVTPVQWQYAVINNVDWNAFRGTLDQYIALNTGDDMLRDETIGGTASPGMGDRNAATLIADVWNVIMQGRTQGGGLWGSSPFLTLLTAAAADEARDAATLAAIQALADVIKAGGGSVDVVAIGARIDAAVAQVRADVTARFDKLAAAAKAQADTLAS